MPTALYRRYRPDTFDEVIGQDHVTGPLKAALAHQRANHAYLFSGPRGCGKTTSARILARCLNCAQGPTPTPCGECESCRDLATGGPGSLDVVEIDAASHNGVDDARDLRERAVYAPARDRYKIFILDEAHMVTPQGFNALLKLVEEPPEHVKFVFATTEPEKVIGTIRSRTHHYPFRLVPPEIMTSYLDELCRREDVPVGKGVLPLVVRAGGGSVRDSLSVLDQLMAGAGEEGIDYATAVALLGYTPESLLGDIVDALSAGDGAAVYRVIDRVIESGQDPRRFVEDLLERFRDLIVVGTAPERAAALLPEAPADHVERLAQQAQSLGAAELSRAADLLNAGLTEMTGATSPRLQLELICARILLPSVDDQRRGVLSRLDRMERRVGMSAAGAVAPGAADTAALQAGAAPTGAEAQPGSGVPGEAAGGGSRPADGAARGAVPSAAGAQGTAGAARGVDDDLDAMADFAASAESMLADEEAAEGARDESASGGDGSAHGSGTRSGAPSDGGAADGASQTPAGAGQAGGAQHDANRASLADADPRTETEDRVEAGSRGQAGSGANASAAAAPSSAADGGARGASAEAPSGSAAQPSAPAGRGARGDDPERGTHGPGASQAPGQDGKPGQAGERNPAQARAAQPAGAAAQQAGVGEQPDADQAEPHGGGAQTPGSQAAGSQAAGSQGAGSRASGTQAPGEASAQQTGGQEIDAIRRAWPNVLDALGQRSRLARAIISSNAVPQGFADGALLLGFNNESAAANFNRNGNDAKLAEAIDEVLGIRAAVRIGEVGAALDTSAMGGGQAPPPQREHRRPSQQEFEAVVGKRAQDQEPTDRERYWQAPPEAGPGDSGDDDAEAEPQPRTDVPADAPEEAERAAEDMPRAPQDFEDPYDLDQPAEADDEPRADQPPADDLPAGAQAEGHVGSDEVLAGGAAAAGPAAMDEARDGVQVDGMPRGAARTDAAPTGPTAPDSATAGTTTSGAPASGTAAAVAAPTGSTAGAEGEEGAGRTEDAGGAVAAEGAGDAGEHAGASDAVTDVPPDQRGVDPREAEEARVRGERAGESSAHETEARGASADRQAETAAGWGAVDMPGVVVPPPPDIDEPYYDDIETGGIDPYEDRQPQPGEHRAAPAAEPDSGQPAARPDDHAGPGMSEPGAPGSPDVPGSARSPGDPAAQDEALVSGEAEPAGASAAEGAPHGGGDPGGEDDDLDFLGAYADPTIAFTSNEGYAQPQAAVPQQRSVADDIAARRAAQAQQPPDGDWGYGDAPPRGDWAPDAEYGGGPGNAGPQPRVPDPAENYDDYDTADDPELAEAPEFGVPVVERLLGGQVLEEFRE
ncbi:DNA polymerase III subunit gamma and tau [Brevibacterium sp. BRM-1]|uniref:DNA polymerase III subunit gamma and tau n=1 Tax=Brevibacterium sp. BRM-1 TaxID=2999062 RepID=UPI00228323D6|nr:DNA polymerase III subunit gamma and tau [Brevibacterium sp. BRM-1]WAL39189.1 DNA polymerase III subunit gamma and tau [Brevibacterium sp. BRM-1]